MSRTCIQDLSDPFLWLEEVASAGALEWVRCQNQRTLEVLENDPSYAKSLRTALQIANHEGRLTLDNLVANHVYNLRQDEYRVRGIWRRSDWKMWASEAPNWITLVDVDELARSERRNWVFKGSLFENPLDANSSVLIALSDGGKDAIVYREFDQGSGLFREGGFALPEAKSTACWKDRDTLLVATDFGKNSLTSSGYPFTIRLLRRGQALEDAVEIFRGKAADQLGSYPFRLFDGSRPEHFVARSPTFFTQEILWLKEGETRVLVPLRLPSHVNIIGLLRGDLIFQTLVDAELPDGTLGKAGAVYAASLETLSAISSVPTRAVAQPTEESPIVEASIGSDCIFVTRLDRVSGDVERYRLGKEDKWKVDRLSLPRAGTVSVEARPYRKQAFIRYSNPLCPPTLYDDELQILQSEPHQFDPSPYTIEQSDAVSTDGTKIPYFLVHKKGLRPDCSTPTLLNGYGGFRVSRTPSYRPEIGKLWLDRGGAFVIANIRGGGEFGHRWHEAGLKTRRQVVYDDFIAVAESLIERGVTRPEKLGIIGGSNGGLLMGVMLVQRPELFGAAVIQVPLLDMLRFHLLLAGASWIDEYGSPEVEQEREFLAKLSPYHNIDPAKMRSIMPLLVTSTKDDRVHPAHARKFAARLEAAQAPYLYFESLDGGHGAASNRMESARRQALEFTYLTQRLMRN